MPTVDRWVIPVADRKDATLSLDAPQITVSGVRLGLYPRVGTDDGADWLTNDPLPLKFNGACSFRVPRELLQKAAAVYVEASVVVKQPAAAAGKVSVSGQLTMDARKSALSGDFILKQGDVGGLIDLTWWITAT